MSGKLVTRKGRGLLRRLRLETVLVVVLIVPLSVAAAEGVWTELPRLPMTIANNAVTSVDHGDGTTTVYSFMGIEVPTMSSTITPASFKLFVPGGTWESIADAPLLNNKAKIGANAIAVAGEVYLIGGYTAGGAEVTEPRLFRYDPAGDEYVELAEVPVEVDDTVAGVYADRYIYLVSGWHGPFNNNVPNVQVYDTQTDVWVQATPIPAPLPGLFGHAGTIIGDRVVYMDGTKTSGGFTISDRVFVGRIDAGAGVTEIAWGEVAVHPGSPTYRAAASQGAGVDGRMLLVGGTDNPYNFNGFGYNGQPSLPLDQVLAYDPVADDWETISTVGVHVPTMDHRGLVRAGDCWVTVGGMVAPGLATDRAFRLRVLDGVLGDLDGDDDADLADYEILLECVSGPGGGVSAGCETADWDCDGDIDFSDFGVFQLGFSGE